MTQSDCEEQARVGMLISDEAIPFFRLLRPLALAKGGQTIAIRLIGARNDANLDSYVLL